mgnify:FL=1
MNRERLLFDAKNKVLALAEAYTPPEPVELSLPGATARTALNLAVDSFVKSGKATNYDGVIADQLAIVLSGAETDMAERHTEQDILALERTAFIHLLKKEPTLDRLQHMLESGKPLRN